MSAEEKEVRNEKSMENKDMTEKSNSFSSKSLVIQIFHSFVMRSFASSEVINFSMTVILCDSSFFLKIIAVNTVSKSIIQYMIINMTIKRKNIVLKSLGAEYAGKQRNKYGNKIKKGILEILLIPLICFSILVIICVIIRGSFEFFMTRSSFEHEK